MRDKDRDWRLQTKRKLVETCVEANEIYRFKVTCGRHKVLQIEIHCLYFARFVTIIR